MAPDTREIDVAMAITRHPASDTFLILKKAAEYGGRYDITPWEVPGGKIEKDETAAGAAVRELDEETGIVGRVVETAEPYEVQQPGKDITFHPVLIETDDREVQLADSHEHIEHRWVAVQELGEYVTDAELPAFEHLNLL